MNSRPRRCMPDRVSEVVRSSVPGRTRSPAPPWRLVALTGSAGPAPAGTSPCPLPARLQPAARARRRGHVGRCRSGGRLQGTGAAWSPSRSKGCAEGRVPKGRRSACGTEGAPRCWPGCRSVSVALWNCSIVWVNLARSGPRSASRASSAAYGSTSNRIEAISATSWALTSTTKAPRKGIFTTRPSSSSLVSASRSGDLLIPRSTAMSLSRSCPPGGTVPSRMTARSTR